MCFVIVFLIRNNIMFVIYFHAVRQTIFPAVQNNFELLLAGAAVAISGLALILIILVVVCRYSI